MAGSKEQGGVTYFVFQESKIWEAGDPIDPHGACRRVRAKDEVRARRKLPKADLGRKWILKEIVKGN